MPRGVSQSLALVKGAGTLFEREKNPPNRPRLLGPVKLTSAFTRIILFMQASKYC